MVASRVPRLLCIGPESPGLLAPAGSACPNSSGSSAVGDESFQLMGVWENIHFNLFACLFNFNPHPRICFERGRERGGNINGSPPVCTLTWDRTACFCCAEAAPAKRASQPGLILCLKDSFFRLRCQCWQVSSFSAWKVLPLFGLAGVGVLRKDSPLVSALPASSLPRTGAQLADCVLSHHVPRVSVSGLVKAGLELQPRLETWAVLPSDSRPGGGPLGARWPRGPLQQQRAVGVCVCLLCRALLRALRAITWRSIPARACRAARGPCGRGCSLLTTTLSTRLMYLNHDSLACLFCFCLLVEIDEWVSVANILRLFLPCTIL